MDGRAGLTPLDQEIVNGLHGVDDLLEAFLHLLPAQDEDMTETATTRVAVAWRPNVGKSTLVNTILGEERALVSDVPGTTRDPIDTHLDREGQPFLLTDMADQMGDLGRADDRKVVIL